MELFDSFLVWVTEFLGGHLYEGIFLAALIETIIPPIPTLAIFPTAGFLASLYISFIEQHILDLQQLISQKEFQPHHDAEFQFLLPYAYASCVATILPKPCFDSFSISGIPLTEKSIMENYARNIELNYGDWQMSDRFWNNENNELELPAIICTEFVADGITQYRMAKWVDSQTISSFENHRNDSLCDKWLAPNTDNLNSYVVTSEHYPLTWWGALQIMIPLLIIAIIITSVLVIRRK